MAGILGAGIKAAGGGTRVASSTKSAQNLAKFNKDFPPPKSKPLGTKTANSSKSAQNLDRFNKDFPPPKSKPLNSKDDIGLGGTPKNKPEGKPPAKDDINTPTPGGAQSPQAGLTTKPDGSPLPYGTKTDGRGGYVDGKGRKVNEQGDLINTNGHRIDKQGNMINDNGKRINADGKRINNDGSLLTGKQKVGEHFSNHSTAYLLGGTGAAMLLPSMMGGSDSGTENAGSVGAPPADSYGGGYSGYDYGSSSYGIPGSLYA